MVKDGGCPHMNCHICKYDFCWTCGLARKSFFHTLTFRTGETSIMCGFINEFTHNKGYSDHMCIKNMYCRYLLTFILAIIAPPIMFVLAVAIGVLLFPFFPIYLILAEEGPGEVFSGCRIWKFILFLPALILAYAI